MAVVGKPTVIGSITTKQNYDEQTMRVDFYCPAGHRCNFNGKIKFQMRTMRKRTFQILMIHASFLPI